MSAHEVITLKGIEEALGNLDYRNRNALKSRLIGTLMGYYGKRDPADSMNPIPAEELIASLWGLGHDPEALRNKRKNLSSIKASVNTDLQRLYREGRNPEGIVIGPENVFVISDEAKDELLRAFKVGTEGTGTASLGEIREVLAIMNGILSGRSMPEARETGENGDFQAIRDLVKSLSEKVGAARPGPGAGFGTKDAESGGDSTWEATGTGGSGQDGGTASQGSDTGGVAEAEPSGEQGAVPTDTDGPEEPEDALEAVEFEEIEGEVMDFSGEEATEEGGVAQGLGSEVPEAESLEALEGFLEGEPYDELEIVEAEEDPEEVEVLDVGEDEEPFETEVFTETEEIESAGDLSSALGGHGALSGGPGSDVRPHADAKDWEEPGHTGLACPGEGEEGQGWDAAFSGSEALGAQEEPEILEEVVIPEVPENDLIEVESPAAEDPAGALVGEDFDGDVLDLLPAEVGRGIEAGEGTAWISIDIDSEHAMEGFPEGDFCGDPEFLDLEEELEEAEISDTLTDEDEIPDSDVYTAVEEVAASEDLSQGLGHEGNSGAAEPGAFPNEEEPPGLGTEPSGDGTPISLLDETAPLLPEKAKVLAEAFNRSLAAMDRHYNQHLLIPAGEYRVGSGRPSREERAEERVRLDAFYIGKFPVTNAIFEVFVEKTGYRTTAERCGHGTVYTGRCLRRVDERTGRATFTWSSALGSREVQGACWYQPSGPGSTLRGRRNHPVVQVSLEDALAFAAWTGKRLPTEEEWEAASRTLRGFRYPWGEAFTQEACNLETSCTGETTAVDRHPAGENAFGIADALGNVHEWTCGRAGSQGAGEAGSARFIVKGGSWVSNPSVCLWSRTALDRDSHSNILGFRCVAY